MPIITTTDFYSVELCRANPDHIYVFGDNTLREGKGGQAIIRGEPNTLGICTKVSPEEYMSDDSLICRRDVSYDLGILHSRLEWNRTVVLPVLDLETNQTSLGCGLADLPNRAPKIYKALNDYLAALITFYS